MLQKMKRLLAFLMILIIASTTICMEKTVVYAAEVQEDEKITDDEASVYEENGAETFDAESFENAENDIVEKETPQVNEEESISDDQADLVNEVVDDTETIAVHSSDGAANFASLVLFVDFQDTTHEHQESYLGQCLKESAEYTFNMFDGDAEHPFALKQYISKISYGQVELNNIFPQYDQENDQLVPYVLPQNMDYYYGNEEAIIDDAIKQLKESGVEVGNLDLTGDNIVDNITVVVPCEVGNDNTKFRDLRSTYSGTDTIDGVQIGNYNILTESRVYFGLQEGVIAHEFLHTLGYPDLYPANGDSSPVGLWGIMGAVSYRLQYPLSYLRSKVTGWFEIPEVKESVQNYSLVAASAATDSTKDSQAVILKTDYSDTEFFVIEYRKQGKDNSEEYESKIPGSGLIIYRVNTACDSNKAGAPWEVYIFRPGDTYSEDMGGELAEGNLEQAYLSLESGRTSYGSGDFESGLADGAITYSDGKNSGIVIKNVGSIEGDTISFDIEFTDLSQSDYWTMDTSYESGNIQYMDSWMNDGTVYYILKNESSEAVELVQYDGTAWKKLDASLPSDGYDYKIGSYSNDIFVLTYNDTCAKLLRYTEKGWESVFTTAYVVGETALFTTKDGVYFACTDSEHKEVLVYQYTDQILQLGKQTNKAEYATNLSVGAENEQIILEYRDWKQNDKVIVKQYNESSDNWKNVGNLDISTKNSRIYVQNNMVYLIQSDNDSGYIYRYNLVTDNGTWEQYGNAFSDENIAETTMCFQSNSPYIVYQGGLSQKVYVKYLQSNQWKDLGGSATSEKIQGLNAWWSNRNIYLTYLNITNKKVCVKWHEEGSPDKNEDNKQEIVEPAIYQGIDYSDVYDYQYYIKNNSDIKKAYGDDKEAALRHFVNNGMKEGRQGRETFNVHTYKNRYADLRRAYGNDLKKYYLHYIEHGRKEGRTGQGTSNVIKPITVYGGMDYSEVYDYQYYIDHNADIKRVYGDDDLAVLQHFINSGMVEGRQGKVEFNVRTYKNRYADLRKAYGNNLRKYYLHYIEHGRKEGRTGQGTSNVIKPITVYGGMDYSEVYDYQYYIDHNADIKRVYGDDDLAVLQHFINSGMVEGRQGKVEFNVRTYKNRYADLRKAYGNNLRKYYLHYIEHGKKEGRTGKGTSSVINPITVYNGMDYSPVYDYYYYINHNGDIKRVYGDDDIAVLRHFINSGMIEGRIASDKFNVYLYKANYPDLQKAYGNNLKAYYMHYLRNGLNEGRSGNISFAGKQSFQVKNCIVSSFDNTTLTLTLKLTKKDSSISTNEDLYVVLMNSKGSSCVELKKGNVSSGSEISVTVTFTDNDSFKAFAMGKYAIAVKKGDIYQIVSDSCMLKNPEDMARKDDGFKDKYWGYYEGYKVYSKKGIQDADDAYTKDLGVQNVLLNADIQDLVSTTKKAGYVPYTYKGTTYYFSDLIGLKNTINDLHGWGNTENGYTYGKGITRNVTLVLLMSWKHDELSYLIHPSARVKGAAPYYSLNMKDEKARNTFEALFCYMGEELGQMKTRVNNWTLGNELNSCNAWNYAGLMSLNDYVENYAQAFQIIHQAVKRTASSPRLFISLDHCWNVAEAGFSGKAFLDTFASYMNKTAPNMQWNVNFHSYSQPLSNNAFWNDKQNTTDSVFTRYISMRNISVLTNYLASLENTYGKPSGSIRVIIGELGYSSTKGGQESQQAAALGYGYYIAMANKRIDAYIIRAYVDDPVETRAGLYLGLNAVQNGKHVKKTAYEVYKYLDRKQSFDYMNKYLGLIGIKSWSSAIPGFNADEIVAGEKMFQ